MVMLMVPALLMVSTIRFQSFKTFDLGHAARLPRADCHGRASSRCSWPIPHEVLIVIAYAYFASAFVELGLSKLRAYRAAGANAAS